jgi:ribosome-binding protein aMBF1 (putative translation factor)
MVAFIADGSANAITSWVVAFAHLRIHEVMSMADTDRIVTQPETSKSRHPYESTRSPISFVLRTARLRKALGLNELAKSLKINPSLLSRMENASFDWAPHPDTVRTMAEALDLDVTMLFELREKALAVQFSRRTQATAH